MTPFLPHIHIDNLPNFRVRQIPAAIPLLAKDWRAMNWTLDSLEKLGPDKDVIVQTRREGHPNFEVANAQLKQVMKFRDFLTLMREGAHSNDFYMTARNARENGWLQVALKPDVPHVNGSLARELFVWIGPGGTITPWHQDDMDIIFGQLTGYKQVWIVEAKHASRMRRNRSVPWSSDWGDQLKPGPETTLRPPVSFTLLGPGDGLFLPKGTWHRIESLSSSISVSWCM